MSISLNRDSRAYIWMHMNATFIGDMWKKNTLGGSLRSKYADTMGEPLLSTPGSSTEWKKKKVLSFFSLFLRLPETFGHFKYQGRISTRWQSTSKLQLTSEHLLIKNWDLSRKDILHQDLRRNPNLKIVGCTCVCIQIPYLLVGNPQTGEYLYPTEFSTGLRDLTLIQASSRRGSTNIRRRSSKNSSPWRPVRFDFRSYIWLGETETLFSEGAYKI